jgi:carboxymethylenebutenolidase
MREDDMADDLVDPAVIKKDISRRSLAGLSLVVAAAGGSWVARAAEPVAEQDVMIKTADGMCDAVFFHPEGKATSPGVLMWTDIFGLRPAFRDMGRRLAGEGYAVLVPNPFYRTGPAPLPKGPVDFNNPTDRAKLFDLTKPNTPEAVTRDAVTYVDWLDAQKQVNKKAKIGVQGYCMGGPLTVRTAAARPDRVGAGAPFHPGNGLVTDMPDSPHLLLPKIKAGFHFGLAQSDDKQKPDLKDKLRTAVDAAHVNAEIVVYPANHGWCVPDSQVYDKEQAERAWAAMLALYKSKLT